MTFLVNAAAIMPLARKGNDMDTTVETVTFKLAGGATRKDFLAANEAMIDWVLRQPGFQYRSLSEKEDGSWIDIVYWATRDEALAAGEAFRSMQPDAAAYVKTRKP